MDKKKRKFSVFLRLLLGLLFGAALAFSISMSFVINLQSTLPFIVGCSICVLLAIFWRGFCGLLSLIRAKRGGKILTNIIAFLLVISAAIFIVISGIMIASANRPAPSDSTLIILGCQVRGEAPSLMLTKRMEAALPWLLDNDHALCILSGGQGPGEKITEAECMRRWLVSRGIDEGRLLLEEQSTSTRENIRFSADIIEENALSANLVIATDGFHQHRAQEFAKREALTAGAASASTPWWLLPFYWFREIVAIVVQLI